jgi:dihydrofolate reductase
VRTIVYASLTANGHFGRADDGRSIRPEVLTDFVAHVKQAGNVIMGRHTFDLMRSVPAGSAMSGTDSDLVVLSGSVHELAGVQVARRPEEALAALERLGHDTALVGGGAATDDAFLRAGLVDELYLNVLPYLSGPALTIALAEGQFADAELLDTTTLGDGVVQLHYRLSIDSTGRAAPVA